MIDDASAFAEHRWRMGLPKNESDLCVCHGWTYTQTVWRAQCEILEGMREVGRQERDARWAKALTEHLIRYWYDGSCECWCGKELVFGDDVGCGEVYAAHVQRIVEEPRRV